MRVHKILIIALFLAAACAPADRREYTLQGQIISIAPDRMEANVKHEEIKGFMAAMTMPYKVRDAKELEGLKPGDLFTSTLVVISNDAYLENVKKVGEAPLEAGSGASSTTPSASSGFELLRPGEPVPGIVFTDQDGQARQFASFSGSLVVLTFIYTSCPMPTFCPLMDRHFVALQHQIKADPALADVRLLSVSFDPVVDKPPVLKAHGKKLGADPARWTLVTGDRDEIDKFASRFGVSIARDLTDPTNITHNLRTAIVDREGRLAKIYTGNEWTPEQVVKDLKAMGSRG